MASESTSGPEAAPARSVTAALWLAALRPGHWGIVGTLALAFGGLALWAVVRGDLAPAALLFYLPMAVLAALLLVIDARTHRVPNRLVLPGIGVTVLLIVAAAAMSGRWANLGGALGWAAALFAVFAIVALVAPASLGMGDAKLAALLGLGAGWAGGEVVTAWLLLAFVAAGIGALLLLATRRATRHTALALAPYLIPPLFLALPLA